MTLSFNRQDLSSLKLTNDPLLSFEHFIQIKECLNSKGSRNLNENFFPRNQYNPVGFSKEDRHHEDRDSKINEMDSNEEMMLGSIPINKTAMQKKSRQNTSPELSFTTVVTKRQVERQLMNDGHLARRCPHSRCKMMREMQAFLIGLKEMFQESVNDR